jgi:hypothetical protein
MVARCREDILAARGVKPTLSPNLNVLATVEALDVKRLLFIGVGCQVRQLYLLQPVVQSGWFDWVWDGQAAQAAVQLSQTQVHVQVQVHS